MPPLFIGRTFLRPCVASHVQISKRRDDGRAGRLRDRGGVGRVIAVAVRDQHPSSAVGFFHAAGHLGFVSSHGSTSSRLPPGVRKWNVPCPSQVMRERRVRHPCSSPASIVPAKRVTGPAVQPHAMIDLIRPWRPRVQSSPLRVIRPRDISPGPSREPKPEWLKVRAPGSPNYLRLKGLMRDSSSTPSARKRAARTSASAGTTARRRS